jgi:predicted anti-sigma-YlaC factor YlaD
VNIEKEALVVLSALAGMVIAFTLLAGGRLDLGTAASGPFFKVGFSGPQYRGA